MLSWWWQNITDKCAQRLLKGLIDKVWNFTALFQGLSALSNCWANSLAQPNVSNFSPYPHGAQPSRQWQFNVPDRICFPRREGWLLEVMHAFFNASYNWTATQSWDISLHFDALNSSNQCAPTFVLLETARFMSMVMMSHQKYCPFPGHYFSPPPTNFSPLLSFWSIV